MAPDYRSVFAAIPGGYLLLEANEAWTILDASEGYLRTTGATRAIVGVSVFTAFPEHEGSTTMADLRASLARVRATRQTDIMAVQRYDLDGPGGELEPRMWRPENVPVLSATGEVEAIIHRVEDVTETMLRAVEHGDLMEAATALRATEILESMTEGFFLLDRAWRFTELNAEAGRILDMSPSRLIGRTLWEVYPGLTDTEFERSYRRAMDERVSSSFTAFYALHQRWYEVTARPAPHGIAVYFRDATEAKNAADERDRLVTESEQERRMFEAALSNTPDLVYIFDLQKRFIYANEALLRMWGVGRREADGKYLRELGYPEWHAAMHESEIDQVVRTGQPIRGEVPFSGTGGRRTYDYIFVPVLGADGQVVAVAGTTRDVTERKAAEQALEAQAERLREADRAKDEFLAILSHELRNPLAPMRSALGILAGQARDEATVAIHATMARQVEHMVRLVDDLLEVQRITRGTLTLQRSRVSIGEVVRYALETAKPLLEQSHHAIEVDVPSQPLELDGDLVRLAQIVGNLLNNAAKYTPPGGKIRVAAHEVDGRIRVSVRDNGIGIEPALLPKMFDMFTRGNVTAGRGQGGLGIGLSLARRLAQLHGGTLEARSEGTGRGTEVVLELPRLAPSAGVAPSPATVAPSPVAPHRILVVDDNADAGDMLGMLLTRFGATVEIVRDGAAAIERFETFAPDIVFLDIGMPDMDGYAVARALRERFPVRGFTLVALTGWGQEDDKRRTTEAGFDHHMVKPASASSLRAVLATVPQAT